MLKQKELIKEKRYTKETPKAEEKNKLQHNFKSWKSHIPLIQRVMICVLIVGLDINLGKIPQGLIEKNIKKWKNKLNKKKIKSSHKVKTNDEIIYLI